MFEELEESQCLKKVIKSDNPEGFRLVMASDTTHHHTAKGLEERSKGESMRVNHMYISHVYRAYRYELHSMKDERI